jgi:hypothetical protein
MTANDDAVVFIDAAISGSGANRRAVEQALAIKAIASALCVSSRPTRWLRLRLATRDRREDAHRLTILQNALFSPTGGSGYLLPVDQYHLNLRIGYLQAFDQVYQTRAIVEIDVPQSASAARKAIPKVREQTHVDSHGRRYAGFPVSSVA